MRSCRSVRRIPFARPVDDIGATPPVLDAPLLLLLPLLLKLQKFDVFADDGSAVQYHIRAAFFLLNPAPFKMWAFPPTNNGS